LTTLPPFMMSLRLSCLWNTEMTSKGLRHRTHTDYLPEPPNR
jgi:hypothetical protein